MVRTAVAPGQSRATGDLPMSLNAAPMAPHAGTNTGHAA